MAQFAALGRQDLRRRAGRRKAQDLDRQRGQILQTERGLMKSVVPAKAGTHQSAARHADKWIPASAGMTTLSCCVHSVLRARPAFGTAEKAIGPGAGRDPFLDILKS